MSGLSLDVPLSIDTTWKSEFSPKTGEKMPELPLKYYDIAILQLQKKNSIGFLLKFLYPELLNNGDFRVTNVSRRSFVVLFMY